MDGQDERVRIRSGRRRFLLGLFSALFLLAVVSLLAGLLAAKGDSSLVFEDGDPPGWAEIGGMVLTVLGLAMEIGGLVWAVRSGRFRAGRESQLWAVSWRRRGKLMRQVRRGVVDTDDDLSLLGHTARQMVNQVWFVLPLAGLATMHVGQALFQYSLFWLALGGAAAALFTVAAGQVLRDGRRAEAFLHAHPDVAGATVPGASPRNSSTDHWS